MSRELLLSVLIPSIPSRFAMAQALFERLATLSVGMPVEILMLVDNKSRSIGLKRDALVQVSRAKFCAFCDDDDRVADNYFSLIIPAIQQNPEVDVIVFNQRSCVQGRWFTVRFGLEHENQQLDLGREGILPDLNRKPFHVCPWKTALAKKYRFEDSQYGEDWNWAKNLVAEAKSQHRIQEVLHYYIHDELVSEAK